MQVVDLDPLGSTDRYVIEGLIEHGVFTAVLPAQSKAASDWRLSVRARVTEDAHFGAELVGAVFRGLLLGLADGAFADDFDYEVHLAATLKRGRVILKNYTTVGRYRGTTPKTSHGSPNVRTKALAWDHAVKRLAHEIKKDRSDIVALMNSQPRAETP